MREGTNKDLDERVTGRKTLITHKDLVVRTCFNGEELKTGYLLVYCFSFTNGPHLLFIIKSSGDIQHTAHEVP